MALATAHDVRVRHFGLEKLHSCLVSGQCPDVPAGMVGGGKWRRRAVTYAIRPYGIMSLMLCGDVPSNPGPRHWRYPCGTCAKPVMRNQEGIQCDVCDSWYHLNCLPGAIHISTPEYNQLSSTDEGWACWPCQLPPFPDSFFEPTPASDDSNVSTLSSESDDSCEYDVFHELRTVRTKCRSNVLISHPNINSLRNTFQDVSDIFTGKLVDILFVSETKLDSSFTQAQFDAPGYRSFRKDLSGHGGGIIAYVRSDLPSRQRPDLEIQSVESIVIESTIAGRKWAIVCAYRPPTLRNSTFTDDFTVTVDRMHVHFDNIIVV